MGPFGDAASVSETQRFLKEGGSEPFFVATHLMGAHEPYEPAKACGERSRPYERYRCALRLLDHALDEDPELASLRGYAEDTGEGRWTVDEAVRRAVPLHAISAALFARFTSRQDDSPAMKAVAALRNQFGGHAVRRD